MSKVKKIRREVTIGGVKRWISGNSEQEYAEKMFDALRSTDLLSGIDTVYAVLPETTDGISLAIYNRMLRAAAFNIIEL